MLEIEACCGQEVQAAVLSNVLFLLVNITPTTSKTKEGSHHWSCVPCAFFTILLPNVIHQHKRSPCLLHQHQHHSCPLLLLQKYADGVTQNCLVVVVSLSCHPNHCPNLVPYYCPIIQHKKKDKSKRLPSFAHKNLSMHVVMTCCSSSPY